MLARIGLVALGLVLVGLVLLGVGVGTGFVHVGPTGIAFGRVADDAADEPPPQTQVVSADDLLRKAGLNPDTAVKSPIAVVAPKETPKPAAAPQPKPPVQEAAVIKPADVPSPKKPDPKPPADVHLVSENHPAAEPAGPAVVRVLAGAKEPWQDARGNTWSPDSGFVGGQFADRTKFPVENTHTPELYRHEHWGMSAWEQPVANGSYLVKLHFAENWIGITGPGQRVATLNVQGVTLQDIDVFKEAGGLHKSMMKTVPVIVADGRLHIDFIQRAGAEPEINAIEVVPQDAHGPAVVRVTAGSTMPLRDPRGNAWDADSNFDGGEIVDRGPIAIANTDNPGVYRTEHYVMTGWHKEMPNGKYAVNLHFAETCDHITAAGQRVFHMNVQGVDCRDFDVFKEAGGHDRALIKTFHVAVADGRLFIRFERTDKDAPEINGVEVIPE
ncbi:MAG TPA: malectin domain-containing carbohydrate-binding protein [Tepidisphaeraceae bacterium]|jgi:hypothetical protein|nr:malectin domain-containing carbohydrate-binding protein [Tepidisphaeraceae bacterium]